MHNSLVAEILKKSKKLWDVIRSSFKNAPKKEHEWVYITAGITPMKLNHHGRDMLTYKLSYKWQIVTFESFLPSVLFATIVRTVFCQL